MTEQPNPYEPSETETKGVLVGETKTPLGQRGASFWVPVGCLVYLAIWVLLAMGLAVWVFWLISGTE
ncbi:hypothetical protein N9248_02375 [bacterium]|nr:hypothetical protein [bacterium]